MGVFLTIYTQKKYYGTGAFAKFCHSHIWLLNMVVLQDSSLEPVNTLEK